MLGTGGCGALGGIQEGPESSRTGGEWNWVLSGGGGEAQESPKAGGQGGKSHKEKLRLSCPAYPPSLRCPHFMGGKLRFRMTNTEILGGVCE